MVKFKKEIRYMRKKEEDHFLIRMAKGFFPQAFSWFVATSVALAVFRTDITNITRRVDAMEQNTARSDVVTAKLEGIIQRIDGLSTMVIGLSNKLDKVYDWR